MIFRVGSHFLRYTQTIPPANNRINNNTINSPKGVGVSAMMKPKTKAHFSFFMLNEYEFIYFASASAVANLANSAGCRLTGPITSHERDPFVSGAIKMVTISSTIIPVYIMYANISYIRSSSISRTNPSPKEQIIHTNCFPARVEKSRKSRSP